MKRSSIFLPFQDKNTVRTHFRLLTLRCREDLLCGKYRHELLTLPKNDCGHAMVFKDFKGNYIICYHENNADNGNEHAAIYYIGVENGRVKVYEKI